MQTFKLIPYPADELPEIEINCEVERTGNRLSIRYTIQGEVNDILIPAPSDPTRTDNLWQTTCFEFFLAVPDHPGYWEFNMSPSSEWNAYRMEEYRRVGFREEFAIQQLLFEFKKDKTSSSLAITVDLTPIIPDDQMIELGITAVIETKDGQETFWALAHPETPLDPDFHLRDSFLIEM